MCFCNTNDRKECLFHEKALPSGSGMRTGTALVLHRLSCATAVRRDRPEWLCKWICLQRDASGANFSNIHACLEFCLYAISDTERNSVYIRNDVYYSFSQGGYLNRCGRAEFSSPLAAKAGLFFPKSDMYKRVVSNETFIINNTLYYRTVLSTNLPDTINGSYRGWISNTASGD